MGTLSYNASHSVEFDDRVLAHLQLVIGAKLRRGESFHFSFTPGATPANGRTSIWLHPAIPLVYRYDGSRAPIINRDWVDVLMTAANSVPGLQVVPEGAGGPIDSVA
jgi:hypothetical protein